MEHRGSSEIWGSSGIQGQSWDKEEVVECRGSSGTQGQFWNTGAGLVYGNSSGIQGEVLEYKVSFAIWELL